MAWGIARAAEESGEGIESSIILQSTMFKLCYGFSVTSSGKGSNDTTTRSM